MCPLNLRECSGDKTGVCMLMKCWMGSKYTRWPLINDLKEYTIGDVVLSLRSRRRCSTGTRSGTSRLQAVGSGVFITWELWAVSFRRSRGSFMEPQKSAELHLVVSWLQLWQSGFPSVSGIGPFWLKTYSIAEICHLYHDDQPMHGGNSGIAPYTTRYVIKSGIFLSLQL